MFQEFEREAEPYVMGLRDLVCRLAKDMASTDTSRTLQQYQAEIARVIAWELAEDCGINGDYKLRHAPKWMRGIGIDAGQPPGSFGP